MEKLAYLREFAAGVDPFGYFSGQYGAEAEREGAGKGKLWAHRGLGAAGGVIGSGLMVPSAVSGIITGAQEAAKGGGGIGSRLARGARGFVTGAKKPISGLYHAGRASGFLGRAARSKAGATATPGEIHSIRQALKETPLGVVQGGKLSQEAMGGLARAGHLYRDAGHLHLSQQAAAPLQDKAKGELAKYIAGLGLGGVIGGTGAVAQYEKGRAAEKETKRRIKESKKTAAKKPTRYEQLKSEVPIPVVEGDEGHPLEPYGAAYAPTGAPWLMRKLQPKAELPETPFIYTGGPERRLKRDSLMMGKIDVSPEAALAHEMGHEHDRNKGGLSGRIAQDEWVRSVPAAAGTAGGVFGSAKLMRKLRGKRYALPLSAAAGAAAAGLGQIPTLISETRASKQALEKLRAAGASEQELAQYKKELGSAYGSYKRGALINMLMAGAGGPVAETFSRRQAKKVLGKYASASDILIDLGIRAAGEAGVRAKKRLRKKAAAPEGFYKGEPTSPHTVKFKTEFQGIPINIDRPRGFIMKGTDSRGRDWARRYKYNYGFIPKTLGGDGDGLDVFIGPKKKSDTAFWAIQRKDDGSFDEYKIFLGFENRDEAIAAYRAHIPKKYFKGLIAMKIEMMKAMLGKVNPDEQMKRASALSMADELGWLLRTST